MIIISGLKHGLLDIPYLELDAESIAIIGVNGSGKTTLLQLMAGMQTPDSGRILIDGKHCSEASVGWVGEFPDRTMLFSRVYDELASSLRFRRKGADEVDREVGRVLGMLQREDLRGRETRSLSGGEKALVAFGAALVQGPDLLILDEVDSHLDERTVTAIDEAITASGIPVVSCTQDMDRAAHAGQVMLLDSGRVVAVGSPVSVFGSLEDTCFQPDLWRLGL